MKRIDAVKKGKQWVGETGESKQVVSNGRTKGATVWNMAKLGFTQFRCATESPLKMILEAKP